MGGMFFITYAQVYPMIYEQLNSKNVYKQSLMKYFHIGIIMLRSKLITNN